MGIESVFIEKISEANKNDNLAIFVGAGVSKSSDTEDKKAPSWADLISKIRNEIDEREETDFLKTAQYFYNYAGKDEYYKKLKSWFSEDSQPSIVHKLIFDINPHIVITTNWDSILEKAKQMYSPFYDIICNDRELAESVFQHKIIKMHGDFQHHNIVFKEDDYLNYENNFPLISNYIKSILSTHVVLFIGYSYNDINLKLIIQWLRNNAEIRPDMFLVAFDSKSNQSGYLKNQGIETIILSDVNNTLKGISNLDKYSRMTYTFLDKIHKGFDINDFSACDNTARFLHKKLSPLDKLDGILTGQIQKMLTNCGFVFDSDASAILQFYNNILTEDYNQDIRNVYLKFIEMLEKITNGESASQELRRLFSIFIKAGIKGIMLEKDDASNKSQKYVNLLNFLGIESVYQETYFNFNYDNIVTGSSDDIAVLADSVFSLYNMNCIEDAYEMNEKTLDLAKKSNDYIKLFIALFNKNILLRRLKYEFNTKNKYAYLEEGDIDMYYNNLTSQLKQAVEPVYTFLNFSNIYKYLHSSISDLDKIKSAQRTIDSGGFVYNNDGHRYLGQHINLVNFVLSNRILVEDYSEYKKINRNFIEIALLRQYQDTKTMFGKIELYSCIKYIDNKDLQLLFQAYYKEESNRSGTFDLEDHNKDWLINTVFANCVQLYINYKDVLTNIFEKYIERTLFILSLVSIPDDENKTIFNLIKKIFSEKYNNISIFQAFNFFLGLQYNLYKTQIEKETLTDLINIFIRKIIEDRIIGYEFIALSRNYISNLYGYASTAGVLFENIEVVNELIDKIKKYDLDQKLDMVQNFVLNIYQISIDSIKETIKTFACSIVITDEIEKYKKIMFNNALVLLKMKDFTPENLEDINNFVEYWSQAGRFHSILYTLDQQINYLLKEMNNKDLSDISIKIKESIKNHRETEKRSII